MTALSDLQVRAGAGAAAARARAWRSRAVIIARSFMAVPWDRVPQSVMIP